MFRSVGIDNLELTLAVERSEMNALRSLCRYRSQDERSYILLNDQKEPKIFLRSGPGIVRADLNVPKLAFGHNVRLAGPNQVKDAIRVLETNTTHAVPRLNWQRAEVSRLHLTFTLEVPNFEACAALSRAPRGSWKEPKYYPNNYHNAKSKNTPVIIYDKVKHLYSNGHRLPNDVAREMESLDHSLFRFEVKLNQTVYSELKKHGGWHELSIFAEDLCGTKFVAVLQCLKWWFRRHVPVPIDRTPKIHTAMSAREYAAHNTRRTANNERMREHAMDDQHAGLITVDLLHAELTRIAALERRTLARSLHSALESGVEQLSKSLVISNGRINAVEFEHASRALGHLNSI